MTSMCKTSSHIILLLVCTGSIFLMSVIATLKVMSLVLVEPYIKLKVVLIYKSFHLLGHCCMLIVGNILYLMNIYASMGTLITLLEVKATICCCSL